MKYAVFEEWSYVEPFYERCYIKKATKDDEKWNGWNFVSGAGRDGAKFDIYNSLEEAIVKSGYNPDYIDFADTLDKNKINKILNKYIWDQQIGLKLKGD